LTSTSTVPQKRKLGMSAGGGSKARKGDRGNGTAMMMMDFIDASSGGGGGGGGGEEGDEIDCRCGTSADDGFSIACDVCGRWCHAACFAISKESVPEEWKCWMCAPHNLIGEWVF
jgi:hypothetical protein